uniref:Uncharacterized protein n=1 Tax=Meloidogyne enterolobii TaxID=390850 RepID=A0A6V7X682_MELEN|nr:unnamed protein product [Meloidogyne enterolobii]
MEPALSEAENVLIDAREAVANASNFLWNFLIIISLNTKHTLPLYF